VKNDYITCDQPEFHEEPNDSNINETNSQQSIHNSAEINNNINDTSK
jgi:hypothetical protein